MSASAPWFPPRDGVCATLLLLVPIVVFWPHLSGWQSVDPRYFASGLATSISAAVPGSPWIDYGAGAMLQALATHSAREWLSGSVPWWNPYIGVGMPHAAAVQPAAFYLPVVLLGALRDGAVYLRITTQILAGLATFLLLRRLGMGRLVATLGGILFELCGTFAWFGDPSILPVPFLPLFLLGLERARAAAAAGRAGGWGCVAAAVGFSLVAGFPETAYFDGLLALAWAAVRFGQAGSGERWRYAGKVFLGGGTGLLLAAPLLLAFARYATTGYLGGHETLGRVGFEAEQYPMLLFPYVYGPIFFAERYDIWASRMGGYVGLPLVVLAIAGLAGARREGALRCMLGAWIVLGVANAGAAPGVRDILDRVPMLSHLYVFRYMEASWSLACIVLAAFALDGWRRGTLARSRAAGWAAGTGAVLAVASLAAGSGAIRSLLDQPGYPLVVLAVVLWSGGVAGLLLLVLSRPATTRLALSVAIALGADGVAEFSVPLLSGTRDQSIDSELVGFLRRDLGLQRFYSMGALNSNYSTFFRLASIDYNYVPEPRAWVDHVRQALDPGASAMSLNGVDPAPRTGPGGRIEALRSHWPAYAALAVRYVLTRPGEDPFATMDGKAGALPRLVERTSTADIYELPGAAAYADSAPPCSIRSETRTDYVVDCPRAARLTRRELFDEGWHARVNGQTVRVGPAEGIFQAVDLAAGTSVVKFRYSPPHIGWAWVAMTFGFGLLAWRLRRIRMARVVVPGPG